MSDLGRKVKVAVVLAASAGAMMVTEVNAGSPDATIPDPEFLLTEPPVTGFINDGDQSVVETVYLYLDGCPLVSITPPAGGKGNPIVTMVEPDGECATSVGLADKDSLVVSDALREDGGMHVQLWQDDLSDDLETVGDDSDAAKGKSLIVEISNLYPSDDNGLPGGEGDPVFALGAAPTFWIPGVFGDPSGDLLVAAAASGDNGGDNSVLFGAGPGGGLAFIGGGGSGGGSGSGSGGSGGAPGGIFGGNGPGLPSAGNGGSPGVAAVPLPATLLLLLWALQMMRSYVRRR